MSMYDTVKPATPIICPGCKDCYDDLQTKDTDNLMDTYVEGTTTVTRFPMRELTPEEKEKRKDTKPSIFECFPWVQDLDNPQYIPNPVYQQIRAYTWCDNCHQMLIQKFRFDENGLLLRFEDPYFEDVF